MSAPLALVTGASRGLGRAVAEALGRCGWRVVAGVRDPQRAPAGTEPLLLDVTRPDSIQACASRLQSLGQPLRLLVNNAAVLLDGDAALLTLDGERLHKTLETNLLGPLRMVQALLPCLERGSRVVNVSSGGGQLSHPSGWAPAYCLSKTALNGLTVQLAQALEPRGIAVNAVCPGWVRTDMGGPQAPRSVEEGARSILWACLEAPEGTTGGFYRDGVRLPW